MPVRLCIAAVIPIKNSKGVGLQVLFDKEERQVVAVCLEIPNLKQHIAFLFLKTHTVRLNDVSSPVLNFVVPNRDQAATARAQTRVHLLESEEDFIVGEQVRYGVVGGDHHVESIAVMIECFAPVAHGEADFSTARGGFAPCALNLRGGQIGTGDGVSIQRQGNRLGTDATGDIEH